MQGARRGPTLSPYAPSPIHLRPIPYPLSPIPLPAIPYLPILPPYTLCPIPIPHTPCPNTIPTPFLSFYTLGILGTEAGKQAVEERDNIIATAKEKFIAMAQVTSLIPLPQAWYWLRSRPLSR